MTERDIQLALSYRHVYKSELVVPNVSMAWGECDLLAVSLSGYLTEYEIKVSLSDLRREWKKKRWNDGSYYYAQAHKFFSESIKNYWIAVPDYMAEKAAPLIPRPFRGRSDSVGSKPYGYEGLSRNEATGVEFRKPRVNREAKKITPGRMDQIGRKGMAKYWNLARKMA